MKRYIINFIIFSIFALTFMLKDILSWFGGGTAFNSTGWVIAGMVGIIISTIGILWQSMTIKEYKEPINNYPFWWR